MKKPASLQDGGRYRNEFEISRRNGVLPRAKRSRVVPWTLVFLAGFLRRLLATRFFGGLLCCLFRSLLRGGLLCSFLCSFLSSLFGRRFLGSLFCRGLLCSLLRCGFLRGGF